jgi:uncharacterized protein (TIGR02757 family)
LAIQYETADFLKDDPAQFMHCYTSPADIEIVGLIAATLAFGQRPIILQKVSAICKQMEGSPERWIKESMFVDSFPDSPQKFYRFYSFADMRCFFFHLQKLLLQQGSIGEYVHRKHIEGLHPLLALTEAFKDCPSQKSLIPRDTHSCCKRVNMYLRWMVRTHSEVDMGLWKWINRKELIIPADTHVMQESIRIGIIDKAGNSLSKALEITEAMRTIWPNDPCKGDFALFGWGVNREKDVKSIQKEHTK